MRMSYPPSHRDRKLCLPGLSLNLLACSNSARPRHITSHDELPAVLAGACSAMYEACCPTARSTLCIVRGQQRSIQVRGSLGNQSFLENNELECLQEVVCDTFAAAYLSLHIMSLMLHTTTHATPTGWSRESKFAVTGSWTRNGWCPVRWHVCLRCQHMSNRQRETTVLHPCRNHHQMAHLLCKIANGSTCQRAVDAQAVGKNGGRDHLVLGHLSLQLLVCGLIKKHQCVNLR